jgi:hypothetical protein
LDAVALEELLDPMRMAIPQDHPREERSDAHAG